MEDPMVPNFQRGPKEPDFCEDQSHVGRVEEKDLHSRRRRSFVNGMRSDAFAKHDHRL